jgi:hypothetical protein
LRARPEPTQLEHLSDASFLGKLLVFPPNLRLDWKVIANYKHSSLFGFIDSDEGKQFYNIVPEDKVIKLFTVVIYVFHNKLEHLSLAN